MKVTDEHIKAFDRNYGPSRGVDGFHNQIKNGLQAVFDTFPTEPTPEQIERAIVAYRQVCGTDEKAMAVALKAAMTEPPPVKYPWAEEYSKGSVLIHVDADYEFVLHVPDVMEFDYENLIVRLKK